MIAEYIACLTLRLFKAPLDQFGPRLFLCISFADVTAVMRQFDHGFYRLCTFLRLAQSRANELATLR